MEIPLRDKSVDLAVCSPPYLGQRVYGPSVSELGREHSVDAYCQDLVEIGRELRRVLKGPWCLNIGDKANNSGGAGGDHKAGGMNDHISKYGPFRDKTFEDHQFLDVPGKVLAALQADGWRLRSYIVWDKRAEKREDLNHVKRPRPSWEPIFVLQYGKGGMRFFPEQMKETGTVWHFKSGQPLADNHFAPFPDELPRRCILMATQPGDVVLDIFSGSGTTVRVAEGLERRGIGMDLYL